MSAIVNINYKEKNYEDSLVIALNKAILEIYMSHDFTFRERTHIILTIPRVHAYTLPSGLIKRDSKGKYLVKYNSSKMEKGIVTIDYHTLTIGENAEGDEIYSLQKDSDMLSVPVHLEALMKEAIITRTMLNTIASESDENFSAYKKQADKAYKLLVKYSKGVGQDKSVKF